MLQYLQITKAVTQRNASLLDVQKEHEGQRVCASAMAVGKDARNRDATKVQRVERHSAKPTEEGDGVSIWDALKVQKERLISA